MFAKTSSFSVSDRPLGSDPMTASDKKLEESLESFCRGGWWYRKRRVKY